LLFTGENLHRKAVYEPSIVQRVKIFACSKGRLTVIVVIGCLIVLVLALLIAISTNNCEKKTFHPPPAKPSFHEPTKHPDTDDYIATNGRPFPYHAIRLPDSVIPVHYNIFIHPNITESYFKGSVEMLCDIKQSTGYIVFHIKDLNISSLSLKDAKNDQTYSIKEYLEYKKNEQVYVDLRERLTPGSKVKLKVNFEGQLISKLAGFYKSMYKTKAGEKR